MPVPVVPLIGAAASIINNGLNAFSQGSMNKKTRKWNEHMYDRQRADSLADYAMQNEYNSPSAEMSRLKAAGLNPNMVYGNGGATHDAAPIRSSSVEGWSPRAPQYDLSPLANSAMSYYDVKMKEAQIDNLKTMNTVNTQEAILKSAQTWATMAQESKTREDIKSTAFDTGVKESLKETTLSMAKENLNKLKVENNKIQNDIMLNTNADERAKLQNASSLQVALEQILRSRAERATSEAMRNEINQRIENLKKDGLLKQLDIDLKSLGIQPNDNMLFRIIARYLNTDGTPEGMFRKP